MRLPEIIYLEQTSIGMVKLYLTDDSNPRAKIRKPWYSPLLSQMMKLHVEALGIIISTFIIILNQEL